LPKDKATNEVTAEKFAEFLAWLAPDEAKAGEEYERLRFRLITFFGVRNCRFPEDLADETINRVVAKIGLETVDNKTAYVYGFAKNVFLESLRKEKDHVNIDDISVASRADEAEPDAVADYLDKCLGELSVDNRNLILEYFSEEKQAKIDLHRQLADALQTTQVALRMRIVRIKRRLQACLQECMA
jgi:DNA-directed RNA polymerase specialized sigma24 family protein